MFSLKCMFKSRIAVTRFCVVSVQTHRACVCVRVFVFNIACRSASASQVDQAGSSRSYPTARNTV
eukprot:125310-Chlamydomonas_euryale.AAC.4